MQTSIMKSGQRHPLVSVIIPTYNRRWILAEAIESVLSQTFCDHELIVVDDGSTDGTESLLKSFDDITVVFQENRGVSAARNRGIAQSSGKFLAFLDSDDLWLPEKLAAQMAFFDKQPSARICQTQEIWIRNGKRIHPKKRHRKISGMFFEQSLELCLVSPSAVVINKNLMEEMGGFDETLPACEDYDLWLRIGASHPVYLVDLPLVVKRGGHTDQLSAQRGLDRYRIQSLVKILQQGRLSDSQQAAAVATLQRKCGIYATGCLKRGKDQEAAYYHRLAASCGSRFYMYEQR